MNRKEIITKPDGSKEQVGVDTSVSQWGAEQHKHSSKVFGHGAMVFRVSFTHLPSQIPPSCSSCIESQFKVLIESKFVWVCMDHRTSADLFKTAFDLLVSVTLFLGRFDMRTMQVNSC